MTDDLVKCAECGCGKGGVYCDWIASTPGAYRDAILDRDARIEALESERDKFEAGWMEAEAVISELRNALAAKDAEVARLRGALTEIADRHIPDQPAGFGGDDLQWAQRQHGSLRAIARATLNEKDETDE